MGWERGCTILRYGSVLGCSLKQSRVQHSLQSEDCISGTREPRVRIIVFKCVYLPAWLCVFAPLCSSGAIIALIVQAMKPSSSLTTDCKREKALEFVTVCTYTIRPLPEQLLSTFLALWVDAWISDLYLSSPPFADKIGSTEMLVKGSYLRSKDSSIRWVNTP